MQLKLYKYNEEIPKESLNDIKRFDFEGISDYIIDPYTFNIGVITDDSDNRTLGIGIILVVNEFKMVLDPALSGMMKAKAIKLLMDKALELRQCKEIIVSLTLPNDLKAREEYRELLENHYNFCKDNGIILRLGLGVS